MGPLSERLPTTKDFTTMKVLLLSGFFLSIVSALAQDFAPQAISQDGVLIENEAIQYQERFDEEEPYELVERLDVDDDDLEDFDAILERQDQNDDDLEAISTSAIQTPGSERLKKKRKLMPKKRCHIRCKRFCRKNGFRVLNAKRKKNQCDCACKGRKGRLTLKRKWKISKQ